MASQVNNIGTTAIIIFILILLMGGLYYTAKDISTNNTKLDTKSNQTITNLGAQYIKINNATNFETENGDFNDSNFDDVDPYSRQYLEGKSEIDQKRNLMKTVLLYPSIVLSVFGVEDMVILSLFSGLIYGLIAFMLGLQIYKAIRGEVD